MVAARNLPFIKPACGAPESSRGPQVKKPGRQVDAKVNIADLYQLLGELADIDVHKSVPQTVDAQSMLPYLLNPKQPSIRSSWGDVNLDGLTDSADLAIILQNCGSCPTH